MSARARPSAPRVLILGTLLAFAGAATVAPRELAGQEPEPPPADPAADPAVEEEAARQEPPADALRVFLDCSGFRCDFDFFRREIPFVNWVRDRQDAQVHVLITRQRTGAGGRSYSLDFIGRAAFQGLDDELTLAIPPNTAEERSLERLAGTVTLGLMRYVARTPGAARLRVTPREGLAREEGVASPEDDPWNFWVFRVRLQGSLNGEQRRDFISVFGAFSADRITEARKLELSVDGRYSESNFQVDDTTTVQSISRNYEAEGLLVFSLGDHWSLGGQVEAEHSSFRNRDLVLRLAPALEYNLFPYAMSERRQLTFLYSVGLSNYDWREETIFGKTSERRADQSLRVSLRVREPWGEAGGRVEASHLLDDPGKNRLEVGGGLSLRLFRGLSLDISGDVSRVRDQINLPVGDATEEEILLRIRELQTDFEYGFRFGISYTFGSIFSNVVNPRF